MFGYHGKILVVDLTSETAHWIDIEKEHLRQYIGGVGLGAYLLFKFSVPGTDPLDPSSPLIFATSPLVGTRLTTSSKFAVVSKSPLTGFINDSLSSSFCATELKKCGCDAVILIGRAKRPTLLFVQNGRVDFLDAKYLTGLTTAETEKTVKETLKDYVVRVLAIGPAGENLVHYATISNDGGRHAGRGGAGAVMGSKSLKAIALSGSHPISVAQPELLEGKNRLLREKSRSNATAKYRLIGTVDNLATFNRLRILPTQNFQFAHVEDSEDLSGEALQKTAKIKTAHCANCTIGCEQIFETTDSGKSIQNRLEYETLYALGPLCAIKDRNTVIKASKMCDLAGLDTVSTGVTIAWAMECFEQGLLTLKDTEGIELRFGNTSALIDCVDAISNQTGIGKLLYGGCKKAAMALGQGSDYWAMHVKGLEMPGYEPRGLKTMALGLAVNPRGACHNRSSAYEADFAPGVDRFEASVEKGKLAAEKEDYSAVLDSMIWCKFLRNCFEDFYTESSTIYEMVTGMSMTAEELEKAGTRINTLRKCFNIREGWHRKDDTLPRRILEETYNGIDNQATGLTEQELSLMIDGYYHARGWDTQGKVPTNVLRNLDLLEIVKSAKGSVK